jgi:dCMP deaminase
LFALRGLQELLMADWKKRMLDLAQHVAGWSKDRSTGVGCVVYGPVSMAVLALGYNGFPRGADDDVEARHERPLKYKRTEHAERNAIFNAAKHGVALYRMHMASTLFPCSDCARAIVQAGIRELVVPAGPDFSRPTYGEDFRISVEILEEGGVRVRVLDCSCDCTPARA